MGILEELAQRPDAYQIADQIQSFLENEKAERRKFHALVHENMKAEFINGEVVMHSPVKLEHLEVSTNLSFSITGYVKQNDLGKLFIEKAMIHFTRNDYEPDMCFFNKDKVANLYPGQLLFPAPDFIVEIISASTEKNDRTIKMQDYALHGVLEYWIVDPIQQSVEQYLLDGEQYSLHVKLIKEGIIHAKAIKDYSVDLKDIF